MIDWPLDMPSLFDDEAIAVSDIQSALAELHVKWDSLLKETIGGSMPEYLHPRLVREVFCKAYSWAVPTQATIAKIASYSPLIEIGAGTGYWAMLLENTNADILAFDTHPPRPQNKNSYHKPWTYTTVRRGGPKMLEAHPARSLFLCWPPYDSPMAANCLARYEGDVLIYIGEGEGGCNADNRFFSELGKHWLEVETLDIPQWPRLHDQGVVYRRADRCLKSSCQTPLTTEYIKSSCHIPLTTE